jgi:serine/threonine protein kinase
MVKVTKLLKNGGSRFHDVETFRVIYNNPSEFEMFLSLKNAEQDGMHDDDFVHVAVSRLPRLKKKECVIKANMSNTLFLKNELKAMRLLQNYPHVVQYLCHFECKDDKNRWKKDLGTEQFACDPNGTQNITFIVMEYIKYGRISKLLKDDLSNEVLSSLFLHTAYLLYELGKVYKISHGDLNTGNILIKRTKKKSIHFMNKFEVKTFGYKIVFVDFGRSYISKSSQHTENILTDITTVLDIYRNYIRDKNDDLSKSLEPILLQDVSQVKFKDFIESIKTCFAK